MKRYQERLQRLEENRKRLNRLRQECESNLTDESYGPVSYGVLRLLFADLDRAQGQDPKVFELCAGCGDSFEMLKGYEGARDIVYCGIECHSKNALWKT